MKTQKRSLSGFFNRVMKNKRTRNKNVMRDLRKIFGGLKTQDMRGMPWKWRENRRLRKEEEGKDKEDEELRKQNQIKKYNDAMEKKEKEDHDYHLDAVEKEEVDPNETDLSRYVRENKEEYGGRRSRRRHRRHSKKNRKSRKY